MATPRSVSGKGKKRPEFNKDGRPRRQRSPNLPPPPESPFITVQQAAVMMGESKQQIFKLIAAGALRSWKFGRNVRLLRTQVQEWIDAREVRP